MKESTIEKISKGKAKESRLWTLIFTLAALATAVNGNEEGYYGWTRVFNFFPLKFLQNNSKSNFGRKA